MDNNQIKILTLNMHKGFSAFNRNFVLHELKAAIRKSEADIVFLQEVTGENRKHEIKQSNWPEISHYEFLADEVWSEFAYGKNAVYPKGHHGNAILSKFPIVKWEKIDISTNRLEDRGFLYAMMQIPNTETNLHCICVHLGLWAKSRKKQLKMIHEFIEKNIPASEPILFAGDFNDWSQSSVKTFVAESGLEEIFLKTTGRHAKTFPSWMPILKLDRIYYRNMEILECEAYDSPEWSKLTDHIALLATVNPTMFSDLE